MAIFSAIFYIFAALEQHSLEMEKKSPKRLFFTQIQNLFSP